MKIVVIASVDLTSPPKDKEDEEIPSPPFERIEDVYLEPPTSARKNPIPGRFSDLYPPSRMIPICDEVPEGWNILDIRIHECKLCGCFNYLLVC